MSNGKSSELMRIYGGRKPPYPQRFVFSSVPHSYASPAILTEHSVTRHLVHHFALAAPFRRRTPGPPPFSSMNLTPAPSKAVRIAPTASAETWRRSRSKSTIVDRPSFADRANSGCVRSKSALALRHCAGVISIFYVDKRSAARYQYKMLIMEQWHAISLQHYR
jgi:hypothetical protein